MAASWGVLESFWLQIGSGGLVGPSWLHVRGLGSIMVPNWRVLGPSWLSSRESWGHLGSKLEDLGSKLRVLGDMSGPCCGYVGSMLEHVG